MWIVKQVGDAIEQLKVNYPVNGNFDRYSLSGDQTQILVIDGQPL